MMTQLMVSLPFCGYYDVSSAVVIVRAHVNGLTQTTMVVANLTLYKLMAWA